jgi:hypothetical protein
MSEPKTKPSSASVDAYIDAIEDDSRRSDCLEVVRLMSRITGKPPVLWGGSIVGFDTYHYVYASGNSGDWPIVGFSSRKANLTLYIMAGFDRYDELMDRLGKYKIGKSCLYLKKLSDVDADVLEDLIRESVQFMRKTYAHD